MRYLVAIDKRLAHIIWRNGGSHTISAECGSRRKRCSVCAWVRAIFRLLGDPDHCERHAREDGLA